MMADARNQPRRSNWNSRGLRRRDRDRRRRQRSRERMDRAALVVEVDEAVMMIGVRLRGRARQVHMHVAGDRHRFKDIERVVVDQGNDAGDLGGEAEPSSNLRNQRIRTSAMIPGPRASLRQAYQLERRVDTVIFSSRGQGTTLRRV